MKYVRSSIIPTLHHSNALLYLIITDVQQERCISQYVRSSIIPTLHHSNALLYLIITDVQQERCISQWEAHTGEIRGIQYNSNFTSFYSVGADNKVGMIGFIA